MEKKNRQYRIEKELQAVIGEYLVMVLKDNLDGIVSVARVACAKDIKQAKVFISYFHPEKTAMEMGVLKELENHRIGAQDQIRRKINMKYVPKLEFILDSSLEENFEMIQKLDQLGFNSRKISED